jgi:molybdenum cofactor cytidylyltransferase
MNSAIILLAAGASSRLGQSKQLLRIGSETLIEHSVNVALQSGVTSVKVVLGANADNHRKHLDNLPVEIIHNETWSKGMGNSIKVALNKIIKSDTTLECVIIMVCDQPFITSQNIKNLLSRYEETPGSIIVSHYNNTSGVPALFDRSHFEELLSLDDEQGAKKIIQMQAAVEEIDCPEGAYDIDTPEDYQKFVENYKAKNHLL